MATRATPAEPVTEDVAEGGGVGVVAAGILVLAFYVVPAIVRAIRRHRADKALTLIATADSKDGPVRRGATAGHEATRVRTTPDTVVPAA